MSNRFIGAEDGFNRPQPLHELINATTCGSWWGGPRDERDLPIPTMADGAPNGYSVFSFDGRKYSVEFRAANRPASYQMSIFTPDEIAAGDVATTPVLANVFAGSDTSIVEMTEDGGGAWTRMRKVEQPDPFLTNLKAAAKDGTKYVDPMPKCPHLWSGTLPAGLPAGVHVVHVRTTDMFGHVYTDNRTVLVK
jgi:hypothetical protein